MKKLEGKVAIVTGASSGVGRGLAKVLAENGAKVCACARRMEKLEDLQAELAAEGETVLPWSRNASMLSVAWTSWSIAPRGPWRTARSRTSTSTMP